jgi:hypothetical protein
MNTSGLAPRSRKSFKSRFPLPQWDTYFSSLGGPWRKVLQRWSEDFQTTGSREKRALSTLKGKEPETIPYRTCEVTDRNRGRSNGSDTQPVSEIEIRDGGSCRWGSFDHWKLGLVQKDSHCFSLLKNTVTKYTFSLSQILLFGVDLQKRRETLIFSSSWLSTQCAFLRMPSCLFHTECGGNLREDDSSASSFVPHLPIRLRMGH